MHQSNNNNKNKLRILIFILNFENKIKKDDENLDEFQILIVIRFFFFVFFLSFLFVSVFIAKKLTKRNWEINKPKTKEEDHFVLRKINFFCRKAKSIQNQSKMNICNKVLSKAPISWPDVQKQLLNVLQSRTSSSGFTSSASMPINKNFVKQCTDYLIKHIKSLLKILYLLSIW